jgi:hypothetical protein
MFSQKYHVCNRVRQHGTLLTYHDRIKITTMKTRIILFCLMTFALLSIAHAKTPFKAIAKDAFVYIKMPKEMMGGNIEVRDSTGQVIKTINIDHRKIYVDLFEFGNGMYKVTLSHNDFVITFNCTVETSQQHAKHKQDHKVAPAIGDMHDQIPGILKSRKAVKRVGLC